MREGSPCCDSRPLGGSNPATGPRAFPPCPFCPGLSTDSGELLPELISSQRVDAFPSTLPSSSFATMPEHLLLVFWANVSHVDSCFAFKNQGLPPWPLNAQVSSLAHHRSCRFSHLSPRLNLTNLVHPCFSSVLCAIYHTNPRSFCPGLSSHGEKLLFHFKGKGFHEQGQRGRALFARCCCHLPPQFQSFCRGHPHCKNSPRPCWHHTRSQQLLDPLPPPSKSSSRRPR